MQTELYNMGRASLLAYLYRKHGRSWSIVLFSGLLALSSWSLLSGDIRFAILALIYLFILVPMVMTFLYFNYALQPDICFNVLPHFLRIDDDVLKICLPPQKDLTSEKKEEEKDTIDGNESREESKEKDDNAWIDSDLKIKSISLSRIGEYEIGFNEIFIKILNDDRNKKSSSGFLYLPSTAFRSVSDFKDFIQNLYQRKSQ